MSIIMTLLFLIPAVADVLFTLPLVLSFLGINSGFWYIPYYPFILITGIIVILLIYCIIVGAIASYVIRQPNRYLLAFASLFRRHIQVLMVSASLSLSTVLILFVPQIFPSQQLAADPQVMNGVMIFLKLILLAAMAAAVRLVRPGKLVLMLAAAVFLVASGIIVYVIAIVTQEFRPHYYMTFPLNDKDARYIINYDGDYWLTYYEVRNECSRSAGRTICHESLIKKGNTSIAESPVDLHAYTDKAVRVSGSFVATRGPIAGDSKEYCEGKGILRKCRRATGPGVWYASPLKIRDIRLDGISK